MDILRVKANCILDDASLYEHIRLALERNLPLHQEADAHARTAVLIGSGPSVRDQLDNIKREQREGNTLIAVKDAHDWLLSEGVTPDYAIAVDPQEHRWNCFTNKKPGIKYYIASQCHPAMFEHLEGCDVTLWHLYIKEGQTYPPDSLLVTGGTTSGLRTVTLFYSMGFRKFKLYGYDSCLKNGILRLDGRKVENTVDIFVGSSRKKFTTTPEMAAQANEFQMLLKVLPDVEISSFGDGIITTILEERQKVLKNDEASFIHYGNETMASWRYRCRTPSFQLGLAMNNPKAKILVFSKPTEPDVEMAKEAIANGQQIVVDFCDDHFDTDHYRKLLVLAGRVTCSTQKLKERIAYFGVEATVVPDPYEFPLLKPHCNGNKLLWFGHGVNYDSLERVLPDIEGFPLTIVSNVPNALQWTPDILYQELPKADIVILPATAIYKSANRAIEAVRQGCFVVAEPHPSLENFPGIWIGDIRKGIEWATQNLTEANQRTRQAQLHTENFSPAHVANVWRTIFRELSSTSAAERNAGPDGSTLTSGIQTSMQIYENFQSRESMPTA